MATRKCCVKRCNKTRADNTILHKFPNPDKDLQQFKAWTRSIGGDIMLLDCKTVFKQYRVCHSHFETKYHSSSGRITGNAIPTLFLPGVAKWSHIKEFHEVDSTNPNFVYAPKLKKEHLEPNTKQKMKVNLAAQVLSHSVAGGILARISTGGILHRFPNPNTEQELFRAWTMDLGDEVATLDHNFVVKNRRICHKHFDKKYYGSKNRLTKIAIPTLHLPGTVHHFPPPEYPNTEKFYQWKIVLSEVDQTKGDTYIYNNIRLCDHHFEDYYHTPSKRLTKNAIPTLNIDIPLHCFPNSDTDAVRFQSWISNIGSEVLHFDNDTICKKKRVCHKHFESKYLYTKGRLCRLATPVLLMPGADNTILHLFPNPKKDSTRFTIWIDAIGGDVTNMAPDSVFSKHRICHFHFESQYHTWSNRLSSNAIPTLNLPGKKSAVGANITNSGVTADNGVNADSGVITNNRDVTDGANIQYGTENANIQDSTYSSDRADPQDDANDVFINDDTQEETENQIFSWQRDSEINCDDFEMNLDTMELASDQNIVVIENEVTIDNTLEEASPESDNEAVNVTKQEGLHEGYKCDMCKGLIYRFRYSCVECANYDLCGACEARAVHPQHYMLRVPRPRPHGEIQLIMDTIRRFLKADPKSLRAEANFVNTLMDELKSEVLSEADSDPVPVEPDYPLHSDDCDSSEEHDDCEMKESHAAPTPAIQDDDAQDVIFLDENIEEEYEISQEICKTVDTTDIVTASDKERDSREQIVKKIQNKPERIIVKEIDSLCPSNTLGKVSKRIFVTCPKAGSISNDVHKHKPERRIVSKIDSLSHSNALGKAGKRIVLLPLPKRASALSEALQLQIINSDNKKKQETLQVLKQSLQPEVPVSTKVQRLSKEVLVRSKHLTINK